MTEENTQIELKTKSGIEINLIASIEFSYGLQQKYIVNGIIREIHTNYLAGSYIYIKYCYNSKKMYISIPKFVGGNRPAETDKKMIKKSVVMLIEKIKLPVGAVTAGAIPEIIVL
jgi:hypothetical protein